MRGCKILKKNISNIGEVSDMFQQLTGSEEHLDINIIEKKYTKLKTNILACNKLLLNFKKNILDVVKTINTNDEDFENEIIKFEQYIKNIDLYITNFEKEHSEYKKTLPPSIEEIITDEKERKMIIKFYMELKTHAYVSDYLIIWKNLNKYKNHIGDNTNLSGTFIQTELGNELILIPFANINFKAIYDFYLDTLDNETKTKMQKYILILLNMILCKTSDIYKLITTPDFDIEKFSDIILMMIDNLKKELPRCDKAFKLIANSATQLKNNFNTYYLDFIKSKSPTVIMENFVIDIKNSIKCDLSTMRQFTQIINHCRRKSASMPKNPQMDAIFSNLDNLMKIIDTPETQKKN